MYNLLQHVIKLSYYMLSKKMILTNNKYTLNQVLTRFYFNNYTIDTCTTQQTYKTLCSTYSKCLYYRYNSAIQDVTNYVVRMVDVI